MSTKKTDRDIARKGLAHRLNAALGGTGIELVASPRFFSEAIDRVNRQEAMDVIEIIFAATGRRSRQDIRDIDPITPRSSS